VEAKRAQHGNNREHRQHCQPARCAAHLPRASSRRADYIPAKIKSATDFEDRHGFVNGPEKSQIIPCFIGVNLWLDSWPFRQPLQFAQQPLDLFGGVVVREANPHHPSALLHA